MSVFELAELIEAFKSKFNVTISAAPAAAAPARRWWRQRRPGGRRADRVHGHPQGSRREEDPGHQGRARDHRPGPQGSEGPGRRRAADREGGRLEGRGGRDQGQARRAGRGRRSEVRDAGRRPRRTAGGSRRRSRFPGRSTAVLTFTSAPTCITLVARHHNCCIRRSRPGPRDKSARAAPGPPPFSPARG